MIDFYFAICLKPKKRSENWNLVLANLQKTLYSIKRSTNQNYHILISTYDPDDLTNVIDTNKTKLITPNFDPPSSVREADMDKTKNRRLIGSYIGSIEKEPFYVMFLDADDLVHKNLVDFVLSDNNHRGYIISEGYVLDIFERELRRKNEFNMICGSCYIGYFYPEEMPESTDDTECYFSEHRGHRNNVEIATKYQRKPDSIPFPSVVYIKGHEESLETIKRKWKMQRNKMLKFFVLFASVDLSLIHI